MKQLLLSALLCLPAIQAYVGGEIFQQQMSHNNYSTEKRYRPPTKDNHSIDMKDPRSKRNREKSCEEKFIGTLERLNGVVNRIDVFWLEHQRTQKVQQ